MHSQTWQILSTHDVCFYVIQNTVCIPVLDLFVFLYIDFSSKGSLLLSFFFFFFFTKVKSRAEVIAALDFSSLIYRSRHLHILRYRVLPAIQTKTSAYSLLLNSIDLLFLLNEIFISEVCRLENKNNGINKMCGPLNIFLYTRFFFLFFLSIS